MKYCPIWIIRRENNEDGVLVGLFVCTCVIITPCTYRASARRFFLSTPILIACCISSKAHAHASKACPTLTDLFLQCQLGHGSQLMRFWRFATTTSSPWVSLMSVDAWASNPSKTFNRALVPLFSLVVAFSPLSNPKSKDDPQKYFTLASLTHSAPTTYKLKIRQIYRRV